MKIISKYKDYYDYLTHIYGADDKIILDRRTPQFSFELYDNDCKVISFYICGKTYQGVWYYGQFYWGDKIKEIDTRTQEQIEKIKEYDSALILETTYSSFNSYSKYSSVSFTPFEDKIKNNEKEDCPILIQWGSYLYKYPRLDQFKVNQILPPQDIYLALSAWLAPKDIDSTPQTDKEKIVSAGFDLKTSFRGK